MLVEQLEQPSAAAQAWFREVTAAFGVRATLVDGADEPVVGEALEGADLLVNVSGNLRSASLLRRFRRRAYVDLDPGFTQVWAAADAIALSGHDTFFSVGENVGRTCCTIPVG